MDAFQPLQIPLLNNIAILILTELSGRFRQTIIYTPISVLNKDFIFGVDVLRGDKPLPMASIDVAEHRIKTKDA